MDVLGTLWHYGMPALVVTGAAGALLTAFTTRPRDLRGFVWSDLWWLGLTLMATGDAAVGENRPVFERFWKGTAAALVWLAVTVALARRRRAIRAARADSRA